jgi:hypothetical protein
LEAGTIRRRRDRVASPRSQSAGGPGVTGPLTAFPAPRTVAPPPALTVNWGTVSFAYRQEEASAVP